MRNSAANYEKWQVFKIATKGQDDVTTPRLDTRPVIKCASYSRFK